MNLNLRKRTTLICLKVLYSVIIVDGVNILDKIGLLNIIGKKAKKKLYLQVLRKEGDYFAIGH